MSNTHDGPISLSLISLQAQVKTLLEEAGGNEVVELLDALCKIRPSEQKAVLKMFTRLIDKVANGDIRLSEDQSELEAFEESLYQDLLVSIQSLDKEKSPLKLEVLEGGKSNDNTVVNIADLRRARQAGEGPHLQ